MSLLRVAVSEKTFSRGRQTQIVLSQIVFEVGDAEIVAVYGRSGCGKSTLLRIAAGLDRDFVGSVHLATAPVVRPTRQIGMTVQGDTTFAWLTVRENILWPLRIHSDGTRTNGHSDPAKLAELVGLARRDLDKYPHEISAGMKQRVVLARALAAQPSVLLLDEPFSSLDYEARTALQELVLDIRSRENVAFVCVTHDPEEALYLADRLVVLGGSPSTVTEDLPGVAEPRTIDLRTSAPFHARIAALRSFLKRDETT